MKAFFIWLGVQCAFARLLIGMVLFLWRDLKIGPEYLGYFIVPATLICLVETIVSGAMLYPLIKPEGYRR